MKSRFIVLALVLILFVCTVPTSAFAETPVLKVWSFTNELPTMISDYYLADHPGEFEMEFTMVDNDQFEAKLDAALMSGEGPDIWGINVANVKKYVNSGVLADMNDLLDRAREIGIANYVISLGTDTEGTLRTLSFQATPGAIWYRRSIAEKYLGVSEPEDVTPLFADLDAMHETALKLHDASDGKCYLMCDPSELWFIFDGARTSPFVVDDKIVIDPIMKDFMEALKVYMDEGLIINTPSYAEGWYASMSDSLRDAGGDPIEIFCYPNATWFGNFCAAPSAVSTDGTVDTTGDWAIIKSPNFFFNGGTFWGVNANSKNVDLAKKVFEYLTLDTDFLERYCASTGDYPASAAVAEALTPDMAFDLLNNQNHYLVFNEIAGNIVEKYTDNYFDDTIRGFFMDQAIEYANGNKDMDTALNDYQEALIGQYPGLQKAD